MNPVPFLTESSEFRAGLAYGILATLAIAAIARARRPRMPVAGFAFAAATLVAVARTGTFAGGRRMPAWVALGAVVALVLVELAARIARSIVLSALAALPGALITAGALIGVDTWVRACVAVFAAVGAALVADVDRADEMGVAPAMWLTVVAGVYFTVPDTEAARAAIGAAIPLALLGWPMRFARLGAGGAAASTCALGWIIGQGGAPRPGAVVGGIASLGVFALEPLLRRAGRRGVHVDATPLTVGYVTAAHLACVAAASRWAGLAHEAQAATGRLMVFLPVAVALTLGIDAIAATQAHRAPPAPQRR